MKGKQKDREACLNNLLIILRHTTNSFDMLCQKIREINHPDKKVCYVCLSQPYTSIIENLKEEHLSCDNVVFVDALSSPIYTLKPVNNCIFVRGMENLETLKSTVKRVIKKHECGSIVFDSISSLLVYQPSHAIVKFTHELLSDDASKAAKKIYVTLKETGVFKSESTKLINDLNLFADNIIELGK